LVVQNFRGAVRGLCVLVGLAFVGVCWSQESCVDAAAQYHHVNTDILNAIVKVESRGNAALVTRNKNGSIDVGLTGINSVHFKELQSKGVMPEHLLNPCVNVYVAAWHLRKKIDKHGNTWRAIGAYHSETPHHNARYQQLIYKQVVASLKTSQRAQF
jgi:lysozyme-related protein Hpa2